MNIKSVILAVVTFIFMFYNTFSFENLLFKPLTANVFEPRAGSIYEFEDDKLRLDIGVSVDLFETKVNDSNVVRFGADCFTYTRLRSEGRFKFPVETSDYFFGLNASSIFKLAGHEFTSRLRISHISSHLVDGYSKDGEFNKMPHVYSREFIDLVLATNHNGIRHYLGVTYIFSTIPDDIMTIVPEFGLDYNHELTSWLDFIAGYDFKLGGIDNKYSGINSLQAGLLCKMSEHSGISFNYYYYSGYSMHGLFFRDKDNYSGIGFQVNVF